VTAQYGRTGERLLTVLAILLEQGRRDIVSGLMERGSIDELLGDLAGAASPKPEAHGARLNYQAGLLEYSRRASESVDVAGLLLCKELGQAAD